MSIWPKVPLGDLCRSIVDGDHQSLPLAETGIPFITISDISNNRIEFTQARHVPHDYYDKLDPSRKPEKGAVLYSVKGSFGIPVYVDFDDPFTFQRDIAILKCKTALNPHYLYYVLKSPEYYKLADLLAIGSAQRALTLKTLKSIEVPVPPRQIQDMFVSILSTYDNLIETNQRQIKLLEEAAQRLYREWFVDLRFPGHEDVPVVDGVPEGWKKDHAESFFEITIGKTPPRAEKQWFVGAGEGIPWASISDLGESGTFISHTEECLTNEAVNRFNVWVLPMNTILVSFKLTVGRVSIVAKPMCTNEAIAHFRLATPELREYTFSYLSEFEYDSLGNTSSISKAVNSKIIKAMPFVMPTPDIVSRYSALVSPIFDRILALQTINMRLSEARDRLLPKLMSGEIAV